MPCERPNSIGLPKENSFDTKRVTSNVDIPAGKKWAILRYDFVTDDTLTGLQFEPGGVVDIQYIRVFRAPAPVKIAFQNAQATFLVRRVILVSTAIDGKVAPTGNGWAVAPEFTKPQLASFETKQDLKFKGGMELTVVLKQQFQDNSHSLGRFRVAVTDAPRPVSYGIPQNVQKLFLSPRTNATTRPKRRFWRRTNVQIILAKSWNQLWLKSARLVPKIQS